jgi:hypothetical protein
MERPGRGAASRGQHAPTQVALRRAGQGVRSAVSLAGLSLTSRTFSRRCRGAFPSAPWSGGCGPQHRRPSPPAMILGTASRCAAGRRPVQNVEAPNPAFMALQFSGGRPHCRSKRGPGSSRHRALQRKSSKTIRPGLRKTATPRYVTSIAESSIKQRSVVDSSWVAGKPAWPARNIRLKRFVSLSRLTGRPHIAGRAHVPRTGRGLRE